MDQARYREIKAFFLAAAEESLAGRRCFLDKACAEDPSLRAEVVALLSWDACAAGAALDHVVPARSAPSGLLNTEFHPRRIGPYRVLGVLGTGGMGVVYAAEQLEPVRRSVAIKLIKFGMDTNEVVLRFEAERQALALMEHPHIARVYDAGSTSDGRPYFVMERVRGVPITAYCDRHELTVEERLELFAQVCLGVQHAHQRGVIHRDIKPSNILVSAPSEGSVAKIIDFGIAKAIDQKLTERTIHTELGLAIGTPAYMSPEQADGAGRAVDHRTDIYSLGVLLYELLVARVPIDAASLLNERFDAVVRRTGRAEPPSPSLRWSRLGMDRRTRITALRRTTPAGLRRQLRGGLDWIAVKAIDREPQRRYATAAELAEDVSRHLANDPVVAGPQSVGYRAQKFLRRNRAAVSAVSAVVLTLLAGLVGMFVLNLETRRSYQLAEDRRLKTDDALRDARRQTYRANLAAAVLNLDNHDTVEARRRLQACPQEFRGWEWKHLSLRVDAARTVLHSHDGVVHSVAASQTGRHIVSGSGDHSVRLWDARRAELLHVFSGHDDEVLAVDLSADGRRIASGARDATVRLWSAESRRSIRTLRGHEHEVRCVAFSPGDELVASGSEDATIRLWNADSGALLHAPLQHDDPVNSIAFEPRGEHLLAGAGSSVHVWNIDSGRRVDTLTPSDDDAAAVVCVASSPAGDRIAFGTSWSTVRVWARGDSWEETGVYNVPGASVHSVEFNADGSRVLAGSSDGNAFLWDLKREATLAMWRCHDGAARSVRYLQDGQRTVSGGNDGKIVLRSLRSECGSVARQGSMRSVAWSPDGRWIVSAVYDGGGAQHGLSVNDAATGFPVARLQGHTDEVISMVFSPDSKRVVSGSGDRTVRIWDAKTGTLEKTLRGHEGCVFSVACRRDRREIASGAGDDTVRIWNADTGAGKKVLSGHGGQVSAVAYSPNGGHLATGGVDARTRIWDPDSGQLIAALDGHEDDIRSLAFSPDGTRLASASWDRTVHLWDATTWERLRTLESHSSYVRSVAFSPDGERLVSGSADSTLKIWDPAAGDPLLTIEVADSRPGIWCVAFSPDGKTIVSSDDERVRLWGTDSASHRKRVEDAQTLLALSVVVERLFDQYVTVDRVVSALESDDSLRPHARSHAIRLARQYSHSRPEELRSH